MLNITNPAPLIINLCPTGMIPTKSTSPHVPITPKEIALDVKRCYELGICMVHIHARDENENPVWEPKYFQEIILSILNYSPNIIPVVTTSGRNIAEVAKRAAALSLEGTTKPEMASLTLGSMNFPQSPSVNSPETIKELAHQMHKNQIVPELEIFDIGMANYSRYLMEKNILKPPYYFNIILGSLGTANLSAFNLASILVSIPENATWALAGIGRYQLAANTMAIALGGHIRIGLEDNPYYDWNTRSHASNPKLVERIIRIAKEHGRLPATPEEARKIIGLQEKKLTNQIKEEQTYEQSV